MVRIGAFFFSAIVFLMSSSVFASDKPNIIVMVADDLGWADVGFHGNQIIETPSLDRIAAEAQLNRFYTTLICSPARSLDDGRIQSVWALLTPRSCRGITTGFIPRKPSFRVICRRGLSNGDGGEVALGSCAQTYHPNARGFEHFYGHLHTGLASSRPLQAWW